MKQSITELVSVILRRVEQQPDKPVSERALRAWLRGQGYEKPDIDAAMKLARRRLETGAAPWQRPGAVRSLSTFEACKLTPGARDALARLEVYQVIDPVQRELLLEHLGHFDGEVGVDELDYLLSWLICGGRDVESQQTIVSLLDGGRQWLH